MGFLSVVEKCGQSFGGLHFCTVHIGLVPDPGTATHWELIQLPVPPEGGGPGDCGNKPC
jgi:hypothetical protein